MGRIEEILLVLVIAVFFFGKDKLPGLGKAIGQFMDEFKKASSGQGAKEEPKPAAEAAKPQLALPPSEAEKAAKRRKKAPAKKKKAKVRR
ncbi:MAG TPA: twin-arginine translocase TatA/TatE family subunit [bacterium]|nr:twin-arginine translocase TatA/TatE family subunit [bacterium]